VGCAKKSGQEVVPEKVDPLSVIRDTLTDDRDGKTYRTVKIGNQTWMAENLNYETDSSWCYEDNPDNCNKYGRLYVWDAAIKACPIGYHLPTRKEWNILVWSVGGESLSDNEGYIRWYGAAENLMTKNGWEDLHGEYVNRTDMYGFSALPGGQRFNYGVFHGIGHYGQWWTATAYNGGYSYTWGIYRNHMAVLNERKISSSSVRCVQD